MLDNAQEAEKVDRAIISDSDFTSECKVTVNIYFIFIWQQVTEHTVHFHW